MAWDIDRLVALSKDLAPEQVRLQEIREIDEAYWSNEGTHSLTCRDVVEHARLIEEANLAFPVRPAKCTGHTDRRPLAVAMAPFGTRRVVSFPAVIGHQR